MNLFIRYILPQSSIASEMLIARMVLGVPVPLSNSANDVMLHQCSDDTRASLILQQLLQIPTTVQLQPGVNPSHPANLPTTISEALQGVHLAAPGRERHLGPYKATSSLLQAVPSPSSGSAGLTTNFCLLVMAGTCQALPTAPVKPS